MPRHQRHVGLCCYGGAEHAFEEDTSHAESNNLRHARIDRRWEGTRRKQSVDNLRGLLEQCVTHLRSEVVREPELHHALARPLDDRRRSWIAIDNRDAVAAPR